MKKVKRLYMIAALIALFMGSFLVIRRFEKEIFNLSHVSSNEYDNNNVEIKRNKYNLRHFMWSGIFPVFGGLISDPHFLYTKPVDVTDYLSSVINGDKIRYQLIQVNPYFEDKTSENILGLEIDDSTFEYKLETPQDFSSFSSESEPNSVFLYNNKDLYFVMQYNYEDKFLVYEMGLPFNENKVLQYKLMDMNKKDSPVILDFLLTDNQISTLIGHTNSNFYNLYTQVLNKNYAYNQVHSNRRREIDVKVDYGSRININRAILEKAIGDDEFKTKVSHLYEFITLIKDAKMGYSKDTQKIIIEISHENYYEALLLGNSFDESEFAIRKEKKYILISYDYVDRLLNDIDRYKRLREDKVESVVDFKENRELEESQFLVEVITDYKDELTIERTGTSVFIFPTSASQKRSSMNATEYAVSNVLTDEEYLFGLELYGQFSMKLTYDEVKKLENFLQDIKLSDQQ